MTALTFDDVLLIPRLNTIKSRSDVSLTMKDMTGKLQLHLPVFSSNMSSITGHAMACYMHDQGGMGVLHRFLSIEDNCEEFKKCSGRKVFVSLGVAEKELERAEALRDLGANYFCVDVAHAHSEYVGEFLKKLRLLIGNNTCLMAGNVATKEGALFLIEHDVDLIKVGIGGGSVCTTRIKTGFGVPTLQSILDCRDLDRSLVADGGLRTPGDIVKALALGADFVMIGGMLAGTTPTPGEVKCVRDSFGATQRIKVFSGMASKEAQEDYFGKMSPWKTSEGVAVEVLATNNQDQIIADIKGGLRSGLTYGGSPNFSELQKTIQFNVVSQASQAESLPHKKGFSK